MFFGMESDEGLCRTFDLSFQNVYFVRRRDFRPYQNYELPSVSKLINGLSRHNEVDAQNCLKGYAEKGIHLAYAIGFS